MAIIQIGGLLGIGSHIGILHIASVFTQLLYEEDGTSITHIILSRNEPKIMLLK